MIFPTVKTIGANKREKGRISFLHLLSLLKVVMKVLTRARAVKKEFLPMTSGLTITVARQWGLSPHFTCTTHILYFFLCASRMYVVYNLNARRIAKFLFYKIQKSGKILIIFKKLKCGNSHW